MYDVNLQPITSESNIPFDKYLLLYDGQVVMTGKLVAITKEGMQFSRIGVFNVFDLMFGEYDNDYNPTHFAILNLTVNAGGK